MHINTLLQADEKVIVIVRKHWIVLSNTILVALLVAVVPLAIPLWVTGLAPFVMHLFWFFYFMVLTLLWVGVGFTIVDYLLDAWVVTDTRLIDVEQSGLFNRKVTTLNLKNIQDIVVEVSGITQTALHVGTILIETAGEHTRLVIPNAPYPEEVKQIILQTASAQNKSTV